MTTTWNTQPGSSGVIATQSPDGQTVTATGSVTARTLADRFSDVCNVLDYGAVGDGVTDDSAAIQLCVNAAGGKPVIFPIGGTFLVTNTISLTSVHDKQSWHGYGATLKKGAHMDMVTVSGTADFNVHGLTLHGNGETYSGRGVVISGNTAIRPFFGPDVTFISFADSYIEFTANSGTYAKVLSTFMPASTQTEYRGIHVNGPDTVAQHRHFDPTIESGYIDLDGSLSTVIRGIFKRVEISSACSITDVSGSTWGNGGNAMTLSGSNSIIVGCRFAGSVTLDANFSGSFIGNAQTAGSFTDSTIPGSALILHKDIVNITAIVGRNTLYAFPSGSERIQTSRTASVPSSNMTATVGSTAPVIIFAAPFVQNVVLALDTTGAVAGDRFRVVRSGIDSGGPWALTVGNALKGLAQYQWCDVEYSGSDWILTAYGGL